MARNEHKELTSYRDCVERLNGRNRRKLRYSVYLVREGDDILVIHHATAIVRYRPDGEVSVTTDGWQTSTTKANLNRYTGLYVWQEKGIWYYETNEGRDLAKREFHDGLRYFATPDGVSIPV